MKYNRLKRIVSGTLAGAMIMACLSTAVSFAATAYGIKFVTDGDSATTTVIEGGVVNATATLPPNHSFDKENPFQVKIGEADAASGLISISSNNGTYYTIQANDHSAKGFIPPGVSQPSNPNEVYDKTYTLEPKLTAILTDGTGTIDVPQGRIPVPNPPVDPDNPIYPPAIFATTAIKSSKPLPITVNSSFVFEATEDETPAGGIKFSNVTDGKGYFTGFNQPVALEGAIVTAGGRKTLKVTTIGPKGDAFTFEVTTSLPSDVIITNGTKFLVNYRLQEINPLILTVVSPQWAVNETVTSIKNNPVDPAVPDKYKKPYIKLSVNDTLSSITTNFEVLAKVERYNSKDPNMLKVNWEWEPDATTGDDNFKNVVAFGADGRQTRSVTLNPRLDDVKGKLRAQVEYPLVKSYNGETKVMSAWVTTDVTILGTGIPPKLYPLTQTVGQKNPESISKIPTYMDVYNGSVAGFTPPTYPHTFTGKMEFGTGRGRAEKAIIRAEGVTPDALKVYVDNSPIPYEFGTDIINTDLLAGQKALTVLATKSGSVRLYFDYYVKNNKGALVKADSSEWFDITIKDSTPSDFAQLSTLLLRSAGLETPPVAEYPGGAINFGFKADTYLYSNIEIPWLASTLTITPTIPDNRNVNTTIKYEISGGGDLDGIPATGTVETGKAIGGKAMPMHVEAQRTITLTLTAQNGREQIYVLTINRMPPDRNSALKNLTVTDADDGAILKGFSPTQLEYVATVPYRTRWAKFVVEKGNPWATVKYKQTLIENPNILFSEKNWLRLKYKGDIFGGNGEFNGLTNFTEQEITVEAQDTSLHPDGSKMYTTTYKVKIIRADPSTNVLASALTIKDHKDRAVNFDNGAKFDKATKKYSAHIPYSVEKMTLAILPDDLLAQSVTVTSPGGTVTTLPYVGDGVPLVFEVDTPVGGNTEAAFAISFTVKAESGGETNPPYVISIVRNDPDQDSTLTSLEVRDQNDAAIPTFAFNPQTTVYNFSVPFNTEQIRVQPKPRSELATAKVNGETIDNKKPYHITLINPGETKNIKVEIFPEDKRAAPRVYELTVTRELPSTDARLKELTVTGGERFSPRFTPNTTTYSVNIPEGTPSVTFTAVPLAVGSTMTINSIVLASGVASAPYEPYDAKSVVKIEVTAQDGVTKMTYTINVTNQNLLPKSSNADLASLDIREGSMSPRFKAGVTDYEVAVKDDVSSVDILPIPRDEGATMKVFADTKQLGDYYDRYATAIADGETTIRVEVTAENGKATKTYEVIVYRKDEEKQGTYKPITAEMVDYSTNPIVVDISRYTVIAADVLNTLREKHPEKTMVFEGNDYSLQITGKDIGMLIPHTTTFDLGVTFSSPNDEEIWNLIYEYPRNDGIEPVLIHFNHHGALPGKMLFTISLGRTYRTQNATWNYYNEERERIDYYGGVRTNSRGTFTVPITHMSTYLYCKDRIDGAENKSGELGQIGSSTGSSGVSKPNPNTGLGSPNPNPNTGTEGGR